MTDRWLDLSRYQGAPNFDQIKASGQVQGVIAQAGGYGSLADPQFGRDHSEAKRVGLVAGAYYFCDPSQTSADQQVDHFLSLAPDADLYAADVEIDPTGADLTAWCDEFMARLAAKTSKTPWAYSFGSFWTSHYHGTTLAKYPLWEAAYQGIEPPAPPPWATLAAWQYTDAFQVTGISGNVDASWIYAPPTPIQGDSDMRVIQGSSTAPIVWITDGVTKRQLEAAAEMPTLLSLAGQAAVIQVDQTTLDRIPVVKEAVNPDRGNPATYDGLRLEAKIDALKAQIAAAPPGSGSSIDPNTQKILDAVSRIETALKSA